MEDYRKEIEEMFIPKDRVVMRITSYRNIRDNISIAVDGPGESGRYFFKDPYFKLFNHQDRNAATKCARIYFSRPEYVKKHIGLDPWILNSTLKSRLNAYIRNKDYEGNGKIVWNNMLDDLRKVYGNNDNPLDYLRKDIFTMDIPDYRNL